MLKGKDEEEEEDVRRRRNDCYEMSEKKDVCLNFFVFWWLMRA